MLRGTPPETQAQSWLSPGISIQSCLGFFDVLILGALCCWEAEVFEIPAMGQLGPQCLQGSELLKGLLLQMAPEERCRNGTF